MRKAEPLEDRVFDSFKDQMCLLSSVAFFHFSFRNELASFRNEKSKNATELSKHSHLVFEGIKHIIKHKMENH